MKCKSFIILFVICFILGCGRKDNAHRGESVPMNEETILQATSLSPSESIKVKEPSLKDSTERISKGPITEGAFRVKDVEDSYEEGAAQAEEDRLAGHPGANYADDYEDDDENEAYEEGYEDE